MTVTHLALSKVAVGDLPIAPNPTPTANPSEKRFHDYSYITVLINAHLECYGQ